MHEQYLWFSMVIPVVFYGSTVIMVICGFLWSYQWFSMVIMVIGGYHWFSMVSRDCHG